MYEDVIWDEHPSADIDGDRFHLDFGWHCLCGSREQQSQADEPDRSSHRALAASRMARRMFIRSTDVNCGGG